MSLSGALDRAAVALSGLCLVHCLATPVVAGVLPLLSLGGLVDHHFHELMLWLVLPISIIGLALGHRQHGRSLVWWLGLPGMAVIALAATWGHEHLAYGLEASLTIAGTVVLAAAHVLNFRWVRVSHAACA